MPACKAEAHIARSVRSVLAQTYNKWELVIISDDGQDYAAVLAAQGISDSRIKHASTGKTRAGVSTARNIGLRVAQGHIVSFLDDDDMFMPERLSLGMEKIHECGIVTCAMEICDENGAPMRTVGAGFDGLLSGADYKFTNISGDTMLMIDRKKVPVEYDETIKHLEDLDFIMRCFEHADVVFHYGTPLYKYLRRSQSASNNADAFENFLTYKHVLLERLEKGLYKFRQPETAEGMMRFLKLSLETETQYAALKTKNPVVLFEDVLEKNISGGPCRT